MGIVKSITEFFKLNHDTEVKTVMPMANKPTEKVALSSANTNHSFTAYDAKTNQPIKSFNTLSEASTWLQKTKHASSHVDSGISACLHGYHNTCFGFRFKYDHPIVKQQRHQQKSNQHQTKTIYVYDVKTKALIKTFNSTAQAGKWLQETKGASQFVDSNINKCISGRVKSCFGYRFTKHKIKSNDAAGRPVINAYDKNHKLVGQFDSIKEVTNWLIKEYSAPATINKSIAKCLRGKQHTCYHFTFKYHNRENIADSSNIYQYSNYGKFIRQYHDINQILIDNPKYNLNAIRNAAVNDTNHCYNHYLWFTSAPTARELLKFCE